MGAFNGPWLWQGGWPVMPPSESHDGKGAGDCDKAYAFGCPRMYLTVVQQGWLQIMRGHVMDTRAGEKGRAADGDIEILVQTESGLWLARVEGDT